MENNTLTPFYQVGQYVHALKMGWMKPSKTDEEKEEEEDETQKYYMLWKEDEEVLCYAVVVSSREDSFRRFGRYHSI